MGLLTGALSVARGPVRLTLRVWELGLSTAAEAARIGFELLDRDRPAERFTDPPVGSHPAYAADGGPPEPETVVPETGYIAPEPGEVGPEPDVLDLEGAPVSEAPPSVPAELVPDHVDEEPVLVAEVAEAGAEDGAGPELHVDPPWDGYDEMTAADVRDRLTGATPEEAAAVELYESSRKGRTTVLEAAAGAIRRQ